MMRRILFQIVFAFFCLNSQAATKYSNQIFAPHVRSLQVLSESDTLGDPIIHMGTDERVIVGFDVMSHRPHYYSYHIYHCEADWTKSENINEIDYLKGFSENKIENQYLSLNTTFEYTHYYVSIPNDNVELTLSGNYVVEIVDADKPDSVIATACFYVTEDAVSIEGNVSSHTPYGVNNNYQMLEYSVDYSSLQVSDYSKQLKTLVVQNGRTDNQVFNLNPSYAQNDKIIFKNERKLVFEGGTEFDRIDFSHRKNYSGQIDRILFARPYYHVDLIPKEEPKKKDYQFDHDVDGRYKFHAQDVWSDREIDYSIVHFAYKREEPWIDGSLYVAGYFNDNRLDSLNKMTYSYERKQYELVTTLKNGGYNYQYLFLPAGSTVATSLRTKGSHWETENTYTIFVYYRPLGGQTDRLVGVENIISGK
ncbi:MAG: DUF5103 domain-containing protein [Paludibacteraceae bacterium]|nr:DUF5103 domain-containing protein [Paludibacteraceae bacterium]